MLGERVVGSERGERTAGEQVVLVGRVREPPAERVEEPRLPGLDGVDDALGLRARVRAHVGLGRVVAHAERHDADGREPREAVEDAEQRVVERVAVVDARAHDDLAVHLDAGVEQRREPAEAGGAAPVAQQARAQGGVGGVDADVERAEVLRHHALEVGLGEPGERREVPVEEREAVVVVLQVQALPHALRELVDEAERAVVVAGAHPVEDRAVELEAERRARRLVDDHELLEAAAAQLELDPRLVGLDLVPDDVAHRFAVERDELVTGEDARGVGRRAGRDRHHTGGRHGKGVYAGIPHTLEGDDGRTRAARRTARVLRRCRDGDQGALVDGRGVRPARVLLPRDRAQPARGRPVPRAGRGVRRRRRRRPGGRAAHAVGARFRARSGRGRARPRPRAW